MGNAKVDAIFSDTYGCCIHCFWVRSNERDDVTGFRHVGFDSWG